MKKKDKLPLNVSRDDVLDTSSLAANVYHKLY